MLFTVLAILFWMGIGAVIALLYVAVLLKRKGPFITEEDFQSRLRESYAPYSELLAKPCWVKCGSGDDEEWKKHRIVAVSHKGAINVRPWDDESGRRAFWIQKHKVAKMVEFDEGDGR